VILLEGPDLARNRSAAAPEPQGAAVQAERRVVR